MYLGDVLGRYASSKAADGTLDTAWTTAYPHGDSQMAAMRNVLLENNSSRNAKVWNATIQNFIPNHVPNTDVSSAWWYLGGVGAGVGDEVDTAICFAALQKGNGSWINYILPDYQNIMVMHKRIMQQRMGDMNVDGRINFEDFAKMSESWTGGSLADVANLAYNWLQVDVLWWD
jgi:hypothetical protein